MTEIYIHADDRCFPYKVILYFCDFSVMMADKTQSTHFSLFFHIFFFFSKRKLNFRIYFFLFILSLRIIFFPLSLTLFLYRDQVNELLMTFDYYCHHGSFSKMQFSIFSLIHSARALKTDVLYTFSTNE